MTYSLGQSSFPSLPLKSSQSPDRLEEMWQDAACRHASCNRAYLAATLLSCGAEGTLCRRRGERGWNGVVRRRGMVPCAPGPHGRRL